MELIKHQSVEWKERAKNAIQRLHSFGKMRSELYLKLIYLLYEIKSNYYYQFAGYTDFYVFCEDFIGYAKRSVIYFENVHAHCEKFPELKQAILECKWGSILEIIKVIQEHNVNYWIQKAKELPLLELKEEVAKEKKSTVVDKPISWIAKIFPEQVDVVAEAERRYCMMCGITPKDLKRGTFLEHMCAEFLATKHGD